MPQTSSKGVSAICKKNTKKTHDRKTKIPKAVREQVWLTYFGKIFERKCFVSWCTNIINVFDFHVGHDQPECKGGTLSINNLKPICARCNLSMGSKYTIQEWDRLNDSTPCHARGWCSFFLCWHNN